MLQNGFTIWKNRWWKTKFQNKRWHSFWYKVRGVTITQNTHMHAITQLLESHICMPSTQLLACYLLCLLNCFPFSLDIQHRVPFCDDINSLVFMCCSKTAFLSKVHNGSGKYVWFAKKRFCDSWMEVQRSNLTEGDTKSALARDIYSAYGRFWNRYISKLPSLQKSTDLANMRAELRKKERDCGGQCSLPDSAVLDFLHSFKNEGDHNFGKNCKATWRYFAAETWKSIFFCFV